MPENNETINASRSSSCQSPDVITSQLGAGSLPTHMQLLDSVHPNLPPVSRLVSKKDKKVRQIERDRLNADRERLKEGRQACLKDGIEKLASTYAHLFLQNKMAASSLEDGEATKAWAKSSLNNEPEMVKRNIATRDLQLIDPNEIEAFTLDIPSSPALKKAVRRPSPLSPRRSMLARTRPEDGDLKRNSPVLGGCEKP